MIKKFNEYNKFKYQIDDDISFNPDIVKKKKTWYILDTNKILKVSDNIIDLIQIAYKGTELGSYINNKSDLMRSTKWITIDWDEYPDADAVIFGRKTPFGLKIQGIGHDGEPKSKELIIKKLIKILQTAGYWIEASDKLEHVLYKNDVPYISSEKIAHLIFPNSKLNMIGDRGKYYRTLESGKIIKETIFGNPIIGVFNENFTINDYSIYGLFFGINDFNKAINYLDDKNVKYHILHVYDDPDFGNDELTFLILVNNENIKNVDVDIKTKLSGISSDYYIVIDDDEVYFNIFRQRDLDEYGLKEVSKEEAELLIVQNKYNL